MDSASSLAPGSGTAPRRLSRAAVSSPATRVFAPRRTSSPASSSPPTRLFRWRFATRSCTQAAGLGNSSRSSTSGTKSQKHTSSYLWTGRRLQNHRVGPHVMQSPGLRSEPQKNPLSLLPKRPRNRRQAQKLQMGEKLPARRLGKEPPRQRRTRRGRHPATCILLACIEKSFWPRILASLCRSSERSVGKCGALYRLRKSAR
mmetsp:Transcript_81287/g.218621  ORF Transcript_81287/g.218621 Transcript_81287/m.218621 type:complete len:202 (-) Transcript_81287:491-1096(-)